MQSENAEGPASRSDGCVLHADFEKYEDGLIGVFNAGVRWLGDPFATNVKQNVVTITSDPATAFGGRRAAYVFTNQTDQRGRIVLQSRWDAPAIRDEVIEFVFRPVMVGSAELREFVIWSAYSAVGEPVGIVLRANSGHPRVSTPSILRTVLESLQNQLFHKWTRLSGCASSCTATVARAL